MCVCGGGGVCGHRLQFSRGGLGHTPPLPPPVDGTQATCTGGFQQLKYTEIKITARVAAYTQQGRSMQSHLTGHITTMNNMTNFTLYKASNCRSYDIVCCYINFHTCTRSIHF